MTNKNLFLLSVGFFSVALLMASCTAQDEPNTAADTAAINAIWSSYVSSLEAGDIDAWLSLWTEDGVQMPPNEPPMIGKEQIRNRNGAALELFSVEIDIANEETQVVEDLAFSRGTYTATFSPKNGDQAIPV